MEKLLIKVYNNRKFYAFLLTVSYLISLLCVLLFGVVLGYEIYLEKYLAAARILISLFVGFVLVTLSRRSLNAPRPYELYSFYEDAPREKSGESFPSRHAYSAFAIATSAFAVNAVLGAVFLALAAVMCAARVLVGIHFIRDVSAGAIFGALAGVIALALI